MSLDFDLIIDEDICPCCGHSDAGTVFSKNITHNLGEMAEEAGIYDCLWRPIEHNYIVGGDAIEALEEGLKKLKEDPEHYKLFDSPNGWGLYIHFVPFVEAVLEACKKYPNARIQVSV